MNRNSRALPPRRSSGFTLNELLFVVAVVALLAAILFPVFAKARDHAIVHFGCQSNMKIIGEALDQYLQDNNDTYPAAFNDTHQPQCPSAGCEDYLPAHGSSDPNHTWETSLLPYLKTNEFFVCPDDSLAGYKGITKSNRDRGFPVSYSANGMVSCYTGADNYSGCYCRGVMCQASQGFFVRGDQFSGKSFNSSANSGIVFANVHHPEATIAVTETWSADVDSVDSNGNWVRYGDWNEIGGQSGNEPNYGYKVPCGIPSAITPNSSTDFSVCGVNGAVSTHHGRYKDLANFLFCDGHVAAISPPTTNPTSYFGTNPLPSGGDAYDPNDQWDATRP